MRSILILGLGSFGLTLAKDLVRRGNEVAVVDSSAERVKAVRDLVDQAIVADVTFRETLEQMGVEAFDTVVVNLGERIDASILTTLHLHQMGVRNIVVKGISEDHAAVLKMVGADQVVFPERDIALRLSYILSNPNVLDQVLLAPGYSLIELAAPNPFIGKTLEALDLRNRYSVQIIVVKQTVPDEVVFPTREFIVKSGDVLVLMGRDEDLRAVENL